MIDSRKSIIALLFCLSFLTVSAKEISYRSDKIKNLTLSLNSLSSDYEKASDKDKKTIKDKLLTKAKERQIALIHLAQKDPQLALSLALTNEDKKHLAPGLESFIESKKEVHGQLESSYFDNQDSHKLVHELVTSEGKRYELKIAKNENSLPFGAEVSAQVLQLSSNLLVTSGDVNSDYPIAYAGADGSVNTSLSTSTNSTFGEVKVLVLLVNFLDNQAQPYTQQFAEDMVFNQVSEYFRENSYGQSWLTGEVTPWLTLPIQTTDSGFCMMNNLAQHADQMAIDAGYDLSQYQRLLYVMPEVPCGFGGSANVGGPRAYINNALNFRITAHELGHNYGLSHSPSLTCSDGNIIGVGMPDLTSWVGEYWTNCKRGEYGSTVDVMGSSPSGHFNASQKERLGWLEYGSSPDITEVKQSGLYEIEGLASQESTQRPKALKILKAIDPTTGKKIWYYLEFRQPIGFDSIFAKGLVASFTYPENITNGIVIHGVYEKGESLQWLLDMTPETIMGTPRDPALVVGQTFHSPDGDLSITTVSVDGTKAVVQVDFAGSPPPPSSTCTSAMPELTTMSTSSTTVAAGTSVTYSLTVTNYDLQECSNRIFNLSSLAPVGWSTVFANSSLSVAPGKSASTTISVTSPSNSTDGNYQIELNAISGNDTLNETLTYTVENPVLNSSPIAASDSVTTNFETTVSIFVLSNDSDPDGDSISISGHTQAVHGMLLLSNGVFSYIPDTGFSGSDSFTYTIADGKGGSSSALVSITVNSAPTPEPPSTPEDTTAPVVSILSPSDGTTVSSKQKVTITASADDNVAVDRVEFYANNSLACTETVSIYTCEFTIPNGKTSNFSVEARAFDTSGLRSSAYITLSKGDSSSGGKGNSRKR